MPKPLNQEEKERLAALKKYFKPIEQGQDSHFMRGVVATLDMLLNNYPIGSGIHTLATDRKAELLDYVDLLEREHL